MYQPMNLILVVKTINQIKINPTLTQVSNCIFYKNLYLKYLYILCMYTYKLPL